MAPGVSEAGGQLRIIGGRWRGRKFRFRAAAGLRPTPDRVRETLFNWLAGHISGARCLDLFAGSGALGLEALSRGADYCCFVDNNRGSVAALAGHLAELNCGSADCIVRDALEMLEAGNPGEAYNVVFLDPPFHQQRLGPVCTALETGKWLAEEALIYVESSVRDEEPATPACWADFRDKRAGEVRYRLFVRHPQFD